MVDLKSYFHDKYKGGEDFVENVILPIFGEDKYDTAYEEDVLENNPELTAMASTIGISQILRLGTINIPMNPTDVFDITVSSHVQMERNRVSIQSLVRRIMSTFSSAFMIFHYEDDTRWDWRFSFCSKLGNNQDSTDSKRYTFMLGPNQSCRTAADNFTKLAGKRGNIALEDIVKAFDVEALSKEFFEKYKVRYGRFVGHVIGKEYVDKGEGKGEWKDNDDLQPSELFYELGENEKLVRDYIKKLLGRIVFLHFLQKKGWLGATDEEWTNGPQDFMLLLFNNATEEQKNDFLDGILEPMFSCLDTPMDKREDMYDTKVEELRSVRIPFLGGLFERTEEDKAVSVFPSELFADLFKFLSEYNFTIDENDPNDAQVGVDPEMLGRIFENLLEDNKDKGAFYTPKEIVQYMCRESLIAYLQTDVTDEATREALRQFVTTHDVSTLGGKDSALSQNVSQCLKDVKICDPAIGSGAFPMGLLNELFICRGVIEDFENAADIKSHIIQNNIYGVDIEKGAVDIARLRFWLSLITDAQKPSALPNMDFKIMQGNSLLEQYKGFDLSRIMETKQVLHSGHQFQLFEDDVDIIRAEIKNTINQYFLEHDHEMRRTMRKSIQDKIQKQMAIQGVTVDISDIKDIAANDQFFLWHTWFSDVFEQGGFDIVIGNPPYGAKLSEKEKRICKQIYRSAKTSNGIKGSSDTFVIFIEQGLKLLQQKRPLCYIVPLSVGSSDAMGQLHEIIKANCETIKISTYSNRPMQIFESAGLRVAILLCNKTNTRLNRLYTTKLIRRRSTDSLFNIVNNLEFVNSIDYLMRGRFPKVGTSYECNILKLIFNTQKNLQSYLSVDGKPVFYRAAGGRYFNVITDYSTHTSAEKSVKVKYARQIGLCLSSTVFWFYQQVYTDGLNLKSYEINSFPLPDFTRVPSQLLVQMDELYTKYLQDIESKANIRISSGNSSYNVSQFKEYKIVRSLDIIRQIDDIVCPLYGLNLEQTEFIKNYEIEYRTVGE